MGGLDAQAITAEGMCDCFPVVPPPSGTFNISFAQRCCNCVDVSV